MILYIDGPADGGEGVYTIVTEDGEPLAAHVCSHAGWALSDLEARRPARREEWRLRFADKGVWLRELLASDAALAAENAYRAARGAACTRTRGQRCRVRGVG